MSALMPRLRRAALFAVPLSLGLALSACGGGGSSSSTTTLVMPIAFSVEGQANFVSGQPNRGGAAVSALGLATPQGGIATNGTLFYIADYSNNRILGWKTIPTAPTTPPDFVLGQATFTANTLGAPTATQLALPASISITGTQLVVADSGNNRVLIWNTLPTTNNVPADVVVGQTDFVSNNTGTSATTLSTPTSAMIANNQLFVVDQANNRLLIWNGVPTAPGAAANLVLGQADFVSNPLQAAENGLTNPATVWTDGRRLLVSDTGNNRVMYWSSIPHVNNADATYVIGQTDFSRTAAGVGQSALRTPYGVTSDGTSIFIADAGNNRVLQFGSFPIASGASATGVYGQDTFTNRTANDDDQNGQSDTTPSDRTLSVPTGVTIVGGVLYVSDSSNHRVLLFPGNANQ